MRACPQRPCYAASLQEPALAPTVISFLSFFSRVGATARCSAGRDFARRRFFSFFFGFLGAKARPSPSIVFGMRLSVRGWCAFLIGQKPKKEKKIATKKGEIKTTTPKQLPGMAVASKCPAAAKYGKRETERGKKERKKTGVSIAACYGLVLLLVSANS